VDESPSPVKKAKLNSPSESQESSELTSSLSDEDASHFERADDDTKLRVEDAQGEML